MDVSETGNLEKEIMKIGPLKMTLMTKVIREDTKHEKANKERTISKWNFDRRKGTPGKEGMER